MSKPKSTFGFEIKMKINDGNENEIDTDALATGAADERGCKT